MWKVTMKKLILILLILAAPLVVAQAPSVQVGANGVVMVGGSPGPTGPTGATGPAGVAGIGADASCHADGSGNLVCGVIAAGTSVSIAGGTAMTANQGNGTKLQHSAGTTTTNNCGKFDANGNIVDAGAACGTGSGSSNLVSQSPWQRLGAIITPSATQPSPQLWETSAMLDTTPEILTGLSQVVKMTWSEGQWSTTGGGLGTGICGGESPDGITPPTRVATCPIISNHMRSWLMPNRVGGNLVLYATNILTGQLDRYEGTTLAGLTLAHASLLTCGSNGIQVTGTLGNAAVWVTSGSSWSMLYDCDGSDGNWQDWLATSTDAGLTWTKASATPSLLGVASASSTQCKEGGGAFVYLNGSQTHAWVHCGPHTTLQEPTPYIYHAVSSDGGLTFTLDSSPSLQMQTAAEGLNVAKAQFGDAFLLDTGRGTTIMYYEDTLDGCATQVLCSTPGVIDAAIAPMSLSQLTAPSTLSTYASVPATPTTTGAAGQWAQDSSYLYTYDSLGARWQRAAWDGTWAANTLANPSFSPGAGIMSAQNVTIGCVSGASACYTTNGTTPAASTPGTCSTGSTLACNSTVSVSTTEVLQALATKSGSTNSAVSSASYTVAQTNDTFGGTAGTLLTAHTDAGGHAWTSYNSVTTDTAGIGTLNGSGFLYSPTGTFANQAEYLNALTPSSANYTVTATFTTQILGGSQAAVYGRANSGASTYDMCFYTNGTGVSLYQVVAGTVTQLGSTAAGNWTVGTPKTLSIAFAATNQASCVLNGTTVVAAATTTVTGTGQAGIRVGGGSVMYATSFIVQ